jgi:hypothetical protein
MDREGRLQGFYKEVTVIEEGMGCGPKSGHELANSESADADLIHLRVEHVARRRVSFQMTSSSSFLKGLQ